MPMTKSKHVAPRGNSNWLAIPLSKRQWGIVMRALMDKENSLCNWSFGDLTERDAAYARSIRNLRQWIQIHRRTPPGAKDG
jgi:hypothetical protein